MSGPLAFFFGVLLAGVFFWWLVIKVLFPLRELRSILERITAGDFRPVILAGMPFFLRKPADDLRRTAELLARQKALLAEEEFSLSIILESMTEGVVITGSDLKIRLLNKAAASMFNLMGKFSGLLLQEVFMSHELQGVAQRAAETGKVQHGELTLNITARGGRRHLLVTAVSLGASGSKTPDGILLVLHDVTRLRELESVRREFVANVSHEFRTPLSIINGYLETLEEGGVDEEMLAKSLAVMRRHGERLNRLIEDLLTVSRMEEKGVLIEKSSTDLAALLATIIGQMEQEIEGREVMVRLAIPPELPHIEVDPYRMEQAFSNLLTNALRHGTPGSLEGKSTGGIVEISAAVEGAELSVSFRDNGPGIPLKDQEHLFERFYRVGGDRARHTGGTGLGLSIVRNVVKAHGGRVMLESNPGKGSTFTIFLPLGEN